MDVELDVVDLDREDTCGGAGAVKAQSKPVYWWRY
jgi:hypothetical protein